MLLTNIGDLNMRKRILFGSMLVIICMLLLPSTSALQIDDEFEDKIEYIEYGEGLIQNLLKVFDTARKVGIILIVSLLLVKAFLISNTIKITIF